MKLSILSRLMSAMFLLIAFTSNANDLTALPKKIVFTSAEFTSSVIAFDKVNTDKNVNKVCACQLMVVKSGKDETSNVAVFSEKISYGDLSADFAVATQVLEDEKKHMKSFFYNKVRVVAKEVVATDCRTMYNQMKVTYQDLKMFELLDADAITRFKNLNR